MTYQDTTLGTQQGILAIHRFNGGSTLEVPPILATLEVLPILASLEVLPILATLEALPILTTREDMFILATLEIPIAGIMDIESCFFIFILVYIIGN
jgi:hypothetical protein